MISIIIAIHNQLEMNEIFWGNLKKYTHYPFELIIIDNHSSDGSKEFFIEKGATVIANQANYSYPYTQNQGIKIASNDILAFLNNDIIFSPNWDQKILDSMEKIN
jgi:GT2 family glycosyltransferase